MNCHTAKSWMLAAKTAEALPTRIARHLQRCPACQSYREQLRRVEEMTRKSLVLAPNVAALARLDSRLDDLPREEAPTPYRTMLSRIDTRYWAACAAAVLLLGLGWMLGRYTSSPAIPLAPKEQQRQVPEIVEKRPTPEESITPILVRVASLAPRIAGDSSPATRLDILMALADELRTESLRLAAHGQSDDLPRLSSLHDRVLNTGVVTQALRLPEVPEREMAIAKIVLKMSTLEREIGTRERDAPASIAEHLKLLAVSVRKASVSLKAGKPIELPPYVETVNPPPLDGLVTLVLKLSNVDTPLPRAEASAELARTIAQATVLLNVGGKAEYSSQMGDYLGPRHRGQPRPCRS